MNRRKGGKMGRKKEGQINGYEQEDREMDR